MRTSSLIVEGFFDTATSTVSYLLVDARTFNCAIVDSVLDYDPKSGRTSAKSAELVASRVEKLNAKVQWLLETHVHADHLSAAPYLKRRLGGQIGIGARVKEVQSVFGKVFNAERDFGTNGCQFDRLFVDDECFDIGKLNVRVMHTPGHTPACVTYVVSDGVETSAFVGDTLFMPDYGTARCDFPGGHARTLYRSIKRVLGLPLATRLFMCHDYQPGGRPVQFISSVVDERERNVHVHDGVGEDTFVAMRNARDSTLDMPLLMLPAVQVNMRAGNLPDAEGNGVAYIKIPINVL